MIADVENTVSATRPAVEYLKAFNSKAERQRIPISGSIELTRLCNFNCIHCYLGRRSAGRAPELDTAKVLSIIDEICEAGCLYLLITGGEPLLRKDFPEIYRHAKRSGLIVSVFTNGTLVDDGMLDLFQDLPPHLVEVSLYAASEATCERITGVAGSFSRSLRGVQGLLARKVRVGLKTILMTQNSRELSSIRKIATDLGVKFRFDAAIFPRLDGDMAPLEVRVPPGEAIEQEFHEEKRLSHWTRYFEKTRGAPASERLYTCGAGTTGFHIDAGGSLYPCLMVQDISYSLLNGSFRDGWRGVIAGIRELKVGKATECQHCEKRHLCSFCPAFFALENGSARVRSEYVCAIGDGRYRMVEKGSCVGEINGQ